ncbi:MAG: hypothetical protein P8R54_21205 [Myxococcota bacterium]|nr:hypothetical protein [Myxococcota bacterium]
MMLLTLLQAATAAELLAWFPDGPPLPGERVGLQVAVIDGEGPPVVRAEIGTLGEATPLANGLWEFSYRAADAEDRLVATTAGAPPLTLSVTPGSLAEPSLTLSEVSGVAGEGVPLVLRVTGAELPKPADLTVAVAEGRIQSVESVEGALEITWLPTRSPFARAIPIGVLDARRPDIRPTWGVIRLRGRPQLPLQAEPGASVTVTIGTRSYGPFIANASGQVRPRVEVWPGEDTIDILTQDTLGNVGRTRQALGGDALPRLLGLTAGLSGPDAPAPRVFLWAVRPDGRSWRGAAPTCFGSSGSALSSEKLDGGQWSMTVPSDDRLDCSLADQARAVVLLPEQPPVPGVLQLQVVPTTLTADLPRARVRIFLEDTEGRSMSASEVIVGAGLGSLRMTDRDGELSGEYLGEGALSAGGDQLTAAWSRQPGLGAVWDVQLAAIPMERGVTVAGRALNRAGEPVAAVSMLLRAGNQEVTVDTDSLGWAVAELVAETPQVLSASVNQRIAAAGWQPGEMVGRAPGTPDLLTSESITIEAGRVREIFLSTDPRTLIAGGGFSAEVEIRLEDRVGRPILNEDITLDASQGRLTAVFGEPDGRYFATYTPPEELAAGVVQITAAVGKGGLIAATDLRVVPSITQRMTGPVGGWVRGLGEMSSPWLALEHDWKVDRWEAPLFLRVYGGSYRDQVSVEDDVTGEQVSLELTVVPVGVGVLGRQELRQLTGWLGMAVTAAPYYLETRFAGQRESTASALGIASLPGLQLFGGVGRRFPNGELQGQVGGLALADGAKDIGWTGFIGGVWLSAGYKFIY